MKKQRSKKNLLVFTKLMLCFFMLVYFTYSWYQMVEYSGKDIFYSKKMRVSSNGGVVTNYIGKYNDETKLVDYSKLSLLEVVYDHYEGLVKSEDSDASNNSFEASNLCPGSKTYFKTEIYNSLSTSLEVSIYLVGIEYSLPLNTCISFVEVDPAYHIVNTAEETEIDEDEKTCYLSSVRLSENIKVESKQTVTIYWYLEIDSSAGNDCMNAELSIRKMQLTTGA